MANELYTVTIDHPENGTVTIRSKAEVGQNKKGSFNNGDTFLAELDFRTNGDVWAKIKGDPYYTDMFAALKYKGQTFATWEIYTNTLPEFEWPETAEITLGNGQKALYGFLHKID